MAEKVKSHRKAKAGKKAEKRKTAEQKKRGVLDEAKARRQNPKAFAFQSANKAKAQRARSADKEQRRMHAPMMEKAVDEPPPFVVLVHGPPQVGKTTLIKCLVKHFTKQNLSEVKGPITCVSGKKRRITFVECPPDLNGMLDAAKYADLVLLLIDGGFGFEMETFEFLNLLQVHGFPKVMGVLTHLDGFKDQKKLKKTKKKLKARFWTEIYDGAKLFYLSGIQHGKYLKREVLNLARFISIMKMRPLTWRLVHPYILADRFEDITPRENVRQFSKCDREITLYGYLRGCNLKPGARVHIAGVGDYTIQELDALPDPCPLPETIKRRGLNERERLLYAPMADVGGLLYDKDAVYIDIPDWKVQYTKAAGGANAAAGGDAAGVVPEGEKMVQELQATEVALDERLQHSQIRLFPRGQLLTAGGGESSDYDGAEDGDDWSDDDNNEAPGGSDSDDEDASEGGEGVSDDDEEDDDKHHGGCVQQRHGMPKSHVVTDSSGRLRRRALFDEDAAVEPHSDEESDDFDNEVDYQVHKRRRLENGAATNSAAVHDNDGSDDEDDAASERDDDSEGLGDAAQWKRNMMERAASLFATRGADLKSLVYGKRAIADGSSNGASAQLEDQGGANGQAHSGNDSDDDELFKPKRRTSEVAQANNLEAVDALDSSRVLLSTAALSAWEDDDAVEQLRNRFVTGDWAEGQRRAEARPGREDDEGGTGGEDGDEVFGDFEDVETGQVFQGGAAAAAGSSDVVLAAAQKAIADAEAEELRQKRLAKKAAFDAQYDNKGAGCTGEEENADGDSGDKAPAAAKGGRGDNEKEETYYDSVKREMAARQARTKAMLDSLDPVSRVAMEGYRPGTYMRMRFTGVPYELVEFHDPHTPLLIGGLGQNEEKLGVMRLRFKRHRWSPKILKTRDPLVFSVGWRRFQSLPVYAIEDHNRRLRSLKYTPEHQHCIATVYGPLAPPNTGVVAIQNLSDQVRGWRVSGTGVVLELDASVRVVKKLKLVGTPVKIHRHTAFIQGMFNSQLEAAKFEGASIRTVSGIRGTIKKALRPGSMQGTSDGAYRATFEDKILMSDIVFLRAWVAVDIPHFYNPVTNLLTQHAHPQIRALKKEQSKNGKAAKQEPPAPAPAAGAAAQAAADPLAALTVPLSAAAAAGSSAPAAKPATFQPSSHFAGSRPGFVFKLGPQGLGYYPDGGPAAAAAAMAAAAAGRSAGAPSTSAAAASGSSRGAGSRAAAAADPRAGTVLMKTVAQLRQELGIGAPRDQDSLYKPIERAPRVFNPLKIPLSLQAALPFKTKPKLEPARKRKSLEQKRAVVLEPGEKKAYTLVQQLNAIRNEKARKRREQQERKRGERAKKQAKEEAWRKEVSQKERKKRYRDQGQAEKRKEMAGNKFAKRTKRE